MFLEHRPTPENDKSQSLTYDGAPTGSTYENLLADGWEFVYRFNLRDPEHRAQTQKEIDWAKEGGRFTVTMVPTQNESDRRAGIFYVVRKAKT